MTPLKPCPFCGSTDVDTTGNDEVWFVGCNQCEAGYGHSTLDSAKGQWNTRISPWRSLKDDPPKKPGHYVLRGLGTRHYITSVYEANDGSLWCYLSDVHGCNDSRQFPPSLRDSHGELTEYMELPE